MDRKILVLHFLNDADSARVWITDENYKQLTSFKEQPLSDIKISEDIERVVVFVPSYSVLLTSIVLPSSTRASLRSQAALYALEDQLAEDVQSLHAVTCLDKQTKKTSVAIVKKTYVAEWLKKLQFLSSREIIVLPDIFLLPWKENHWYMMTFGDTNIVRCDIKNGFSTQQKNISAILKSHQMTMENVTLINYEAAIQQLVDIPQLNLLQGDYRLAKPMKGLLLVWRWPLIFAVVWLLLLVISTTTRFIYLSYQDNQLNQQISSLYKNVFPQATAIISPKDRINSELSQIEQNASSSDFLNLLAIVGHTINSQSNIALNHMAFSNNQLTISVSASDFKMLEQLSDQLKQKSLTVKLSSATRDGKNVQSSIIIKKES